MVKQELVGRMRRIRPSRRHLSGIREEWRQNLKANQPMEDPEGLIPPPTAWQIMKQSPMNHIRAVRDAMVLYKNSIFDPEEAVREASIDDEFIRQATEKWSSQGSQGKTDGGDDGEKGVVEQKDMDEIMEKVKAMYPEGLPQDLSGAVKELGSRREDIKEVAIDRLEVMAEAMKEFMSGYREGKDESRKEIEDVSDEEAKRYITNFVENVETAAKDTDDKEVASTPRPDTSTK